LIGDTVLLASLSVTRGGAVADAGLPLATAVVLGTAGALVDVVVVVLVGPMAVTALAPPSTVWLAFGAHRDGPCR
jgi:hypothetical protein